MSDPHRFISCIFIADWVLLGPEYFDEVTMLPTFFVEKNFMENILFYNLYTLGLNSDHITYTLFAIFTEVITLCIVGHGVNSGVRR